MYTVPVPSMLKLPLFGLGKIATELAGKIEEIPYA